MAVYAIGDIQGCYAELMALLEAIRFDENVDQLWLTGDLVNRGLDSLKVLRFVRELSERTPAAAITVLGNHDLHLLALAAGAGRRHRSDTLDDVLVAPDRDVLLDWLRHQPVLHTDAILGVTLIHAGLAPQWSLKDAQGYAAELEAVLRGDQHPLFFEIMYGDEPTQWSNTLTGWERLRFITNCFTRLRYCDVAGRLALQSKGAPGTQPAGFVPWFEVPERHSRDSRIIFGHWSTLGLYQDNNVVSLDTGCLWGEHLTALRLDTEDGTTCVRCRSYQRPGGRE